MFNYEKFAEAIRLGHLKCFYGYHTDQYDRQIFFINGSLFSGLTFYIVQGKYVSWEKTEILSWEHGTEKKTIISFEEVLNFAEKELKTELLFNLDIFYGKSE